MVANIYEREDLEKTLPALKRRTDDGWSETHDVDTRDTGLGVYVADLPSAALPAGTKLCLTFLWKGPDRWEGTDFEVEIAMPGSKPPVNQRGLVSP